MRLFHTGQYYAESLLLIYARFWVEQEAILCWRRLSGLGCTISASDNIPRYHMAKWRHYNPESAHSR